MVNNEVYKNGDCTETACRPFTSHILHHWSKTLMELIFNHCGEIRWSPEGPVSQIQSPNLHVGAPGNFSDLLKFVQMLKRERSLLHLSIHSKTATLVPYFVVEDLSLGRTAALMPEFAVKDLPLGQNILMMIFDLVFCPTWKFLLI